ncbi:hypothetical protein ElyMa_006435200, partial [Elysia marginata]
MGVAILESVVFNKDTTNESVTPGSAPEPAIDTNTVQVSVDSEQAPGEKGDNSHQAGDKNLAPIPADEAAPQELLPVTGAKAEENGVVRPKNVSGFE